MDKIFCVEDDESIRDLILYALKSAGLKLRDLKARLSLRRV